MSSELLREMRQRYSEPTIDSRPAPPRTLAERWLDMWQDIGMYVFFRAQSRGELKGPLRGARKRKK